MMTDDDENEDDICCDENDLLLENDARVVSGDAEQLQGTTGSISDSELPQIPLERWNDAQKVASTAVQRQQLQHEKDEEAEDDFNNETLVIQEISARQHERSFNCTDNSECDETNTADNFDDTMPSWKMPRMRPDGEFSEDDGFLEDVQDIESSYPPIAAYAEVGVFSSHGNTPYYSNQFASNRPGSGEGSGRPKPKYCSRLARLTLRRAGRFMSESDEYGELEKGGNDENEPLNNKICAEAVYVVSKCAESSCGRYLCCGSLKTGVSELSSRDSRRDDYVDPFSESMSHSNTKKGVTRPVPVDFRRLIILMAFSTAVTLAVSLSKHGMGHVEEQIVKQQEEENKLRRAKELGSSPLTQDSQGEDLDTSSNTVPQELEPPENQDPVEVTSTPTVPTEVYPSQGTPALQQAQQAVEASLPQQPSPESKESASISTASSAAALQYPPPPPPPQQQQQQQQQVLPVMLTPEQMKMLTPEQQQQFIMIQIQKMQAMMQKAPQNMIEKIRRRMDVFLTHRRRISVSRIIATSVR